MSFGIGTALSLGSQLLPGLLNSFGSGGQSRQPARPSVDYSSMIAQRVNQAVGQARSEFQARMQQQSASTARTLDQYRGTIRDLQNRLQQANQTAVFSQIQAAQSSQASNQPQPVVVQQSGGDDNKTILYMGAGLVVLFVLMGNR